MDARPATRERAQTQEAVPEPGRSSQPGEHARSSKKRKEKKRKEQGTGNVAGEKATRRTL